jgi:hypothetical protein
MRGLLAATAVLGVVAIGGLPVLALTLADAETGAGDTTQTAIDQRPGPPAWAHGHGRDGKPGKPDKAKDDDRHDDQGDARDDAEKDGRPGWARHGDQVTPGWAKQHAGRTPHGWAVREWAHCVADAAAKLPDGEKLDPEAACGARPAPPAGSDRPR